MHPLTIKLIANPQELKGIEKAIKMRLEWEKKGTSASSRESIQAEIEAVNKFKELTTTKNI